MKQRQNPIVTGLIIIVILFTLGSPFLLDYLYGAGALSWYPNNFKANEWFAFIGSYFPAVIFGIITYYNSVIVNKQQREIEDLRIKYRYRLVNDAFVYRYGKTSKNQKDNRETNLKFYRRMEYAVDNAFLAEFVILDMLRQADITSVLFEKAVWTINGNDYEQADKKKGFAEPNSISGLEHRISVYWKYDYKEDEKIKSFKDDINCFFYNQSHHKTQYNKAFLSLYIRVLTQDNSEHFLRISLELEPNTNVTLVKSLNYHCIAEGRKNGK